MSPRETERLAREYCASIGADPDEVVKGYWDTGNGVAEWLESPRWTWYQSANVEWDRPLTGFERAMMAQQDAKRAALAAQRK
jgi:hypothetical protein